MLPSRYGKRLWKSGTYGLLIVAVIAILMANFLSLGVIASLASILVLLVWVVTNLGQFRLISETKANPILLGLATIGSLGALVLFLVYTWGQTPGIVITFVVVTLATFGIEWLLRAIGHKKGMEPEHPRHQPQEKDAG